MSVVGIDIGNDSSVVAVAKHRGIDVLLNDESKRETSSSVTFSFSGKRRQRLIGCSSSSPSSFTISQIKRLVGRPFRHPSVQRDLRLLPFPSSESHSGGVLLQLPAIQGGGGEADFVTPVQALAMLLSRLKHLVGRHLDGAPVSDCVIGVPSYFTQQQRSAYLDAAAIAGLTPLRLIHDTTATALGYGIYRDDAHSHPVVVFVDVGHCDVQVAVVEFSHGGMRVLANAADPDLGSRDFDEVLFDHFAQQFEEDYGINVRSNPRASARLRVACEKLKKVLSANAEAPLSIECLMDEMDVKGFIKREDFELLSSGLLERVLVPCDRALRDAGIACHHVHSVELVGSGSRIPAIVKALGGFFGREPSRTLNASECVARGCALQCAMLSSVVRVRDYEVEDSFPFSIGFSLHGRIISKISSPMPFERGHGSPILFERGQLFPSVKVLTFRQSNSLQLEAFYAEQSELSPGTSEKIGLFRIGPYPPSYNRAAIVKVKICLNLHGILTIDMALLIEDCSDVPTFSNTTHCVNNLESEYAFGIDSTSDAVENGTNELFDPGLESDGTRKVTASKIKLPVSETIYGGMTKTDVLHAQEHEKQLAYQDKLIEQAKERKNALEAYVYEIRNKLFEGYRSFTTDTEREEISKRLEETEDWLYDGGDDETENVYSNKLQELKRLVDPIEHRSKDEEARAEATRELWNCIVDLRMAVQSLATYERDEVINACNKAEQWLRDRTLQQDSLPKNLDPVLWSHNIREVSEILNKKCRNILSYKNSALPAAVDDRNPNDTP